MAPHSPRHPRHPNLPRLSDLQTYITIAAPNSGEGWHWSGSPWASNSVVMPGAALSRSTVVTG